MNCRSGDTGYEEIRSDECRPAKFDVVLHECYIQKNDRSAN
jgi:hypothetical protein